MLVKFANETKLEFTGGDIIIIHYTVIEQKTFEVVGRGQT